MLQGKHWLIILFLFTLQVSIGQEKREVIADTVVLDTVPVGDTTVFDAPAMMYADDEDFDEGNYSATPVDRATTDSFSVRSVPDSITDKLKRRKDFEYANDPQYWVEEEVEIDERREPGLLERIARALGKPAVSNFIIVLLVLGALVLLVRFIISNQLYNFKKKNTQLPVSAGDADAELMTSDLDDRIREALARGDARSAVRFHFIKTLQLLDKKGWISYHPQSTNYNYHNQVNRYAKGQEFGFLLHAYEYVWFGDFKMTKEQSDFVFHRFVHFQSSLKV